MATKRKQSSEVEGINVQALRQHMVTLRVIGVAPLFQNRMSAKVKQGLLTGSKKKTTAEKAAIKHDPINEYRNSMELIRDPDSPTLLGVRSVAIKSAMADAAIETAGMTKAGTQRLLRIPGDLTALYGTPMLRLDVVRSADVARTPDIRSRAFLPRWGAELTVGYFSPQLSAHAVVALLTNAGQLIGIGDYRQQKGKGSFGLFRVIGEEDDDAEWDDLVNNHGRAAQVAAYDDPQFADQETEELMEFYHAELARRAA